MDSTLKEMQLDTEKVVPGDVASSQDLYIDPAREKKLVRKLVSILAYPAQLSRKLTRTSRIFGLLL